MPLILKLVELVECSTLCGATSNLSDSNFTHNNLRRSETDHEEESVCFLHMIMVVSYIVFRYHLWH